MKKVAIAVAGFCGLCAAAACTSASNNRPPPAPDPIAREDGGADAHADGGESEQPGPDATAGDASARDGGSDSGQTDGIAPLDAGPVAVRPGSDAAMAEPICSLTATWSAAVPVPGVPAFASRPFVTMTPDELTIAWVVDAGDGSGDVFVADRASTAEPFGSPSAFPSAAAPSGADAAAAPDSGSTGAPSGSSYFAFDRVALSADGLTLIGVSISNVQMAEFIRNQRGSAFSSLALPSRYVSLGSVLMPGERLGDPVLSADGDDLVYSRFGQSQTVTVDESFQIGTQPWPPGSPQSAGSLAIMQGTRMRPTGLSADRLTLFFWDEVTSTAYGVFRNSPTGAFGSFTEAYGAFFSVQASASCSRLYYVAPMAASTFALVEVEAQ